MPRLPVVGALVVVVLASSAGWAVAQSTSEPKPTVSAEPAPTGIGAMLRHCRPVVEGDADTDAARPKLPPPPPSKPKTAAKPASKPGDSTMPGKRPPDAEVGERLWKQSCWMCHGKAGQGDGPAAAALPGGVPSLEGKAGKERNSENVRIIQEGLGRMPAYAETIDRHDTKRILVYLRKVQKDPSSVEDVEPDAAADTDPGNAGEGAGEAGQ